MISPICAMKECGEELDDYGAIILSNPKDGTDEVIKKHVCKYCYAEIIAPLLTGYNEVPPPPEEILLPLVQICGCVRDMNRNDIVPMVSHLEAEFYGVYIGNPGDYKHHIDRPTYPDALETANNLIKAGKAFELDDKTF